MKWTPIHGRISWNWKLTIILTWLKLWNSNKKVHLTMGNECAYILRVEGERSTPSSYTSIGLFEPYWKWGSTFSTCYEIKCTSALSTWNPHDGHSWKVLYKDKDKWREEKFSLKSEKLLPLLLMDMTCILANGKMISTCMDPKAMNTTMNNGHKYKGPTVQRHMIIWMDLQPKGLSVQQKTVCYTHPRKRVGLQPK